MRSFLNRLLGREQPTNVRPGDLARITRGPSRDRLVTVIEACDPPDGGAGRWWRCEALQPIDGAVTLFGPWAIEAKAAAGAVLLIADDILRPLRDSDGEDETLRIAGRPAPLDVVKPTTPMEPAHA